MKKMTIAMLALAALSAGLLELTQASATTVDCSAAPYCARDVLVPAAQLQASVGDPQAKEAEIIIDVDQPLPFSITFESANGGVITFVRQIREQTSDVSTASATTDGKPGAVLSIRGSFDPFPKGFEVIRQYRVDRQGEATISITHTVREPHTSPYTENIQVHVR